MTILAAAHAGCAGGGGQAEPPAGHDAGIAAITPEPTVVEESAWMFDGVAGRRIRTTHYEVFTTSPTSAAGLLLPRFLEASLSRCRGAMAPLPAPTEPLTVFFLADRGQWASMTASELPPSRAARFLRIDRGGFAEAGRAYYFDLGVRDSMAIAAHEGWHQYVQATFSEPLPVWLDEAIATWMEGFRWDGVEPVFLPWANEGRFERLGALHAAGRGATLRELLDATPDDALAGSGAAALDYYAQAWALGHFLTDDPSRRAALGGVLVAASAGQLGARVRAHQAANGATHQAGTAWRTGPAVFDAFFPGGVAGSEEAWALFVARVCAPGGTEAVASGRRPW